jgi:hypothetical protein
MAQVSRPVLILIGGAALLIALWLVALRPKPIPVEDTPLAATKAIPQAQQAAAASDAANAKVQAASAGDGQGGAAAPASAQPTAATPQTAAPKASAAKAATPATAATTRSERRDTAIARAVADGKVVVLLFWNAKSADDIATRGVLRGIDRHGGKVVVRVAMIDDVAKYTSVTRGVKIAQSPTTLVIGRKGDTRVIVGLTEPKEVSQAVGDALAGR